MKTPYRYTVLRYLHDLVTGEFLNVGVLVYAEAPPYLRALFLPRWGRVRHAYPDLDGPALRDLLRHLQTQYDALSERLRTELPLAGGSRTLEALAASVLPPDDSALQWSPAQYGLADDLEAELQRLFQRLVGRYENRARHQARDDDDVWAQYRRELEACDLTTHLHARTVTLDDTSLVLRHTVKADRWHALEPISLDLVDAESIRAKGYRWLGETTMMQPALADTKLYLLIGESRNESCRSAVATAINTLHRIPVDHEIVLEHEAAQLSSDLARMLSQYRAEQPA